MINLHLDWLKPLRCLLLQQQMTVSISGIFRILVFQALLSFFVPLLPIIIINTFLHLV